ncbi:unnamed protein product, partial [Mesorhabditis belari]|uniref:Uncharacterized protein n=1 Tax=Mesorhabditis belari TaxID=2138241 RepID=A0AAF3ET38_9BILA
MFSRTGHVVKFHYNCGRKSAHRFYEAEFALFHQLTAFSGTTKPYPKGEQRKKACLKSLTEVKLETIASLPSNPEAILLGIDYPDGTPMQRL